MMTSAPPNLPQNYTLSDVENLSSTSAYYQTQAQFSTIRQQAIQQAAQALGMQAALSYESTQIDTILEAQSDVLYRIFDFNQVMYQHNVLPPVLDKANHQVNIDPQGDTIRIAGVTYRILAPVRFVTAPPTWRDYLWMSYPPPQLPYQELLPQNSQEQQLWQTNVDLGWSQGINQAVAIFNINLSTMSRDFDGMLLYKELLLQNMVSPYHLSQQHAGITGTSTNMVIDDETMQITDQPQLQLHSKFWNAAPIDTQVPVVAPTSSIPNASVENTLSHADNKTSVPAKNSATAAAASVPAGAQSTGAAGE